MAPVSAEVSNSQDWDVKGLWGYDLLSSHFLFTCGLMYTEDPRLLLDPCGEGPEELSEEVNFVDLSQFASAWLCVITCPQVEHLYCDSASPCPSNLGF